MRASTVNVSEHMPGEKLNHDVIQGRWKQFKGKLKEQWGRLTDDDLDVIAGRRDQLLGRIQQRHGLARDDADHQLREWENRHPDFEYESTRDAEPPAGAGPSDRSRGSVK